MNHPLDERPYITLDKYILRVTILAICLTKIATIFLSMQIAKLRSMWFTYITTLLFSSTQTVQAL